MTTGLVPAPYTRTATLDGSELRRPTTATIAGSAYNCSATRTAAFSLPESSTAFSLRGPPPAPPRPRGPPLALIWSIASWAARSIDAPRGCEKGPDRPMTIGPLGRVHAASKRAAPTRADVRRGPPWVSQLGRAARLRDFHAVFQMRVDNIPLAIGARIRSFRVMNVVQSLCRFADALERLLAARDAAALERIWDAVGLDRLAREALALARRADTDAVERPLAQGDRRLLAVLERCRALPHPPPVTFPRPH